MAFEITVLTLFPKVFHEALSASLIGKAIESGRFKVNLLQLRDFSTSKHKTVDDTPYGGGHGMLMKVDVLYHAWKSVVGANPENYKTVLLSPQGTPLTQYLAKSWMLPKPKFNHLILVCGHYEGVDERFIELCVDEEWSIGDYVCTGGEFPALITIDVLSRLIPGTVQNPDSVAQDSFEGGLLKYPQYTKPQEFEGLKVPDVLLGGNHSEIAKWRHTQAVLRTRAKRPDLIK